jgi:ComF family protein
MAIFAVRNFAQSLYKGLLQLFYPELCVACQYELPAGDSCFCMRCRLKLSPSDMYRLPENEFTERFWGRLALTGGAAMYYFTRKSPIQRALHRLKYKNQPDIGLKLGREFGRLLLQAPHFQNIDYIVPIPLHPKKERMRGYNQSAMFAQGLAESLGAVHLPRALARNTQTATQTRKKRMDRFSNVETVFCVRQASLLESRHILLVDDVLTTGATLEMCAQTLQQVPGIQLSMATIAIAMKS